MALFPSSGAGASFGLSQRSTLLLFLILAVLAVSLLPRASAFGAGNIPSFAYMEGKAFRHGDIEDILAELLKKTGSGLLSRGSKFGGLDVKRVYFGNWLRDYSQAMDVAALQKLSKQSILNIVMLLGLLAHGYVTGEFEVTSERLGVYLPTEHIDNPKGYADGKDARQFDDRLRGPVDPRELEIDPRSGMKNYIANENGNWDTSSGLVRRTLKRCIEMGRAARSSGGSDDLYEAYRLLGQALHTLEDLPAHSNWCEIALYKLGYTNVFLHVGDNVRVHSPRGEPVAPLVTGTFGSADFIHSLLGEAQDHLSEASVTDLNKAVDDAKNKSRNSGESSPVSTLLNLLAKVPGESNVSRDVEDVSRGPETDPADMTPQEMYKKIWAILSLRDRIMKSVELTIERIPGLSSLVESVTNAINVWVFTLIEPYVKPIMQQAMGGLHQGSSMVINKEDQFEVFDNPNASDPTHSMLSKDHFGLILNEVAGNIATIIVRHTVTNVVKAWDDTSLSAEQVADECLAPMFHPYWYDGRSGVQKEMMDWVANWARSNQAVISRLSKDSVRAHTNTHSGKSEPHDHGAGNSQSYGTAGGGFAPGPTHHAGGGGHGGGAGQGGYGGGGGQGGPGGLGGFMSTAQGMMGGGGGGGHGSGTNSNLMGAANMFMSRDAGGDPDDPRSSSGRGDYGDDEPPRHRPAHHSGMDAPSQHGSGYGDDGSNSRYPSHGSHRPSHRTDEPPAGFMGGGYGNESSHGGGGPPRMPDQTEYVSQSSYDPPAGFGGNAPPGYGHGQYGQPSPHGGFAPGGPPGMPMAPTDPYNQDSAPGYGGPNYPPPPGQGYGQGGYGGQGQGQGGYDGQGGYGRGGYGGGGY